MQYTFQTINRLRQSWQQDNNGLMNSSSCDSNDDNNKIESTKEMIINNQSSLSTKRASSTVIRINKKSSSSNDDWNLRHSINISDLPPRRPERKSTKSSFSALIDSLANEDIDERQCYNDNTSTPQQLLLSMDSNDVSTIITPNQVLRQLAEEVDADVALTESIERPSDSDRIPITHDESNNESKPSIVQQQDLDDTMKSSAATSSTALTTQAPRRRSTMNNRERLSMIRIINETSLSYDSCISSCTFDGSNGGFDESYAIIGQESRFDVCFSEPGGDDTEADPNITRRTSGPAQPRRRSTLSACYVVESNDETNDET